ncbi:MAG: gliding motility-associated-like protein [Parvicellaceae bacterium]
MIQKINEFMTTYLPTLAKSLILSAILFFSFSNSRATTDYVDADWAEIEAAITSGTADTIRFNFAGMVNAANPITINRNLVIISPAARLVEFEGGNAGFEAFVIAPGAGNNVLIQGIAFLNFSNSAFKIIDGIVKIKGCVFKGNSSAGAGGAIEWFTGSGKLEIYQSSFVNNTAANGGAIFSNDDLLIENSMFHQNIATTGNAGAVDVFSGLGAFPIFAFNTFYDNRAPGGSGGAIYSDPVAFLHNNLFTQNTAAGFADADFTSVVSSQGFNYFNGTGTTSLLLIGSDVTGGIAGDLRAAKTRDGYGLHYFPIVNAGSILVDVGTTYVGGGLTDIRRGPRNMDGDGDGVGIEDIGCVEYSFFTVTNTDGGITVPGSLGKVLQDLTFFSSVAQPYYVAFDVLGDITPTVQYPQINKKLEIDGFTQDGSHVPGYKDVGGGFPLKSGEMGVSLIGSGGINNGLSVAGGSSGTKISGFSITNFDAAGIEVSGASDIQIAGNHIGVDVSGNVPGPNGTGIFLQSAVSNIIGGGSVIERNLISANAGAFGAGIHLFDALDNIIDNNLIGTTKDGTNSMGNFEGIVFQGTSQTNKVGSAIVDRSSYAGQAYLVPSNVISGNFNGTDGSGILFDGAQVNTNSVQGNFIGTEFGGVSIAASNYWGVSFINDANGNRVGDAGDILGRNVISSNQDAGIYFNGTAGSNDLVNNWVGTSGDGLGVSANLYGLRIDQNTSGYSMTVGGPGLLDRNIFSGNTVFGIFLDKTQGVATTNRLIFENNFIGLDPAGLAARPNGLGVSMSSARFITFGSDACATCGNIVAGNTGNPGVGIEGTTSDVIFYNNSIGIDGAGGASPNSEGIFVTGSSSYITIGGTGANQANEIASNTSTGIYVDATVTGVDLSGNSIHNNGGVISLGLDLNNDGFTANDPADADAGGNNLQNFPVILNAFECNGSGNTHIEYNTNFQLGNNYAIQFFAADSDNQEGEIYLGEQIISPTAAGEKFTYVLTSVITAGTIIVANASEIVGLLYHTSEFSGPFTVGAPTVTVTPTNPTICGSSDGSFIISYSPPLAPSTGYTVTYMDDGTTVGPAFITTNAGGDLLISGLDSGTISYVVVNVAGCPDTTVGPWILSYPAVPNPVITGNIVVCEDSTETYNVTGGGTYAWTITGGTIIPATGAIVTASWALSGSYSINVTGTIGTCTANYILPVSVNPSDNAAYSITALTRCQSGVDITCSVTGTAGGTFSATPGGLSLNAVTGGIDVSASTPGVYSFIYTTPGPCTAISTPVNVTINADDDPSYTYSSISECTNGTDIVATIIGTPGGTFSTTAGLSLNTVTGDIDVSASAAGSYTVTYTTAGICPANSNLTVTINPVPTFTISTGSPTTCGGTDGTISIDGLIGATTYIVQYDDPLTVGPTSLVSDAAGTILLTGFAAGTYTNFIVTSVAGCLGTDAGSYTLFDPLPPVADAGAGTTSCAGDPVVLGGAPSGTGGSGTFSYVWDNGAAATANPSVSLTTTTNYTLTLIDLVTTCTNVASMLVTVNPLPTAFIAGNANVCEGAVENYTVSAFPIIVWTLSTPNSSSITSSTSSSENLAVGISVGSVDSLFVSVTDASGCTGLDTMLVTIQNLPAFTVSYVSPTTCGGTNGSFTLAGLDPSTMYSITYDDDGSPIGPLTIASDGAGEIPILGLDAGTYNNIFALLTGCSGSDGASYTLIDPLSPIITAVTYNDPTTCGGSDGSIVITLSGTSPAGNYDIDIDGGGSDYFAITNTGSSLTLSGLSSGINVTSLTIDHTITLCTDADPSTGSLVDPPSPVIDSVAYNNPTTCGGTDGSLEIYLSPGSPGGTYGIDIDGGGSDFFVTAGTGNILTVSGLSDGFTVSSLLVEVAATLCSTSDPSTGTLSDPASPLANAGGDTTICDGDTYTLGGLPTASGGLGGPYNFAWDNGAGTISNPTVATVITTQYIVLVTEISSGCAAKDTVDITVSPTPSPTILGPIAICSGDTVVYSVTSSNSLSWTPINGVLVSQALDSCIISWNVSGAGSINVIETLGSCSGSSSLGVTINAKPLLSSAGPSLTGTSCFGAADGTASFSFPAGPPEQWFWDAVSTGANLNITLTGGAHETVYVDANGCRDTSNFTIPEPAVLTSVIGSIATSCVGVPDGTIGATAGGGTPTFTFNWYTDNALSLLAPGSPNDTLINMASGIYYLEVIDGNGCIKIDSVVVLDGAPIAVTITQTVTDSCVNSNSIDFGTVGGPYISYSWSFAAGTPATSSISNETVSFTGVGLHQVYVGVVDGSGCAGSDSVYINIVDTAVVVSSTINPTCFGIADGQIVVNSSGGSGTYNVVLDGTGAVSGDSLIFSSLPVGLHSIVVTDGSGCVSGPIPLILTNPIPLSFDTIVTSATCGLSNGIIVVTNEAGGLPSYQYAFDGGTFSPIATSTGYGPGSYLVVMTDQNGCVDSTTAVVGAIGSLPNTPVLAGPYIFCEGDVFGPITATGTISLGTFDWYIDDTTSAAVASTAGTSATFGSLPSGSHTLYVIHTLTASGCASASGSATIEYWPNDHTMSNIFTVCPSGQVQVDGTVTTGTITWIDLSGDIANDFDPTTVINPGADSSVYLYTYDNSASCSYFDSILVLYDTAGCGDLLPDIANAFSPDGDGINEGWFIEGFNFNTNNHVTIFNRWGDVIHEFYGYNNADVMWMGNNQSGDLMPAGTYFYVIELLETNVSRSGWVQLTK